MPENSLGYALFTLISIGTYLILRNKRVKELSNEETDYEGACHCKTVKFVVRAPKHLVVWNCNCSICLMKKNWHFIVPASSFHNYEGSEALTEYRFNTKTAKHMFCKHCGVQAYYVPRSNPDGIAVTLACVNPQQLVSYEIREYDGQNWEKYFQLSNISAFSQQK